MSLPLITHSSLWLNEEVLGKYLEEIYPEYVFVHDKMVPDSGMKNRPDYRCDELNLIVEFDVQTRKRA